MTRRLLAAVIVALAFPAAASAHAVLLRTVPADRAVSPTPPRQVLVVFDRPVHVGPGNAVVRDGGDSVLAAAPSAQGKALVLPLRANLRDGDYSVRWSVISDDGISRRECSRLASGRARSRRRP
ncbi:MAG TPA: copper resistance protein CopC [Gaiellaceae bacterium]|nr:copper resistance protein CopC [Gaiellaceae bacterium]